MKRSLLTRALVQVWGEVGASSSGFRKGDPGLKVWYGDGTTINCAVIRLFCGVNELLVALELRIPKIAVWYDHRTNPFGRIAKLL
jgi:hypothetical protein